MVNPTRQAFCFRWPKRTVAPQIKLALTQKRFIERLNGPWAFRINHEDSRVRVPMQIQRSQTKTTSAPTFAKLFTAALAAGAVTAGRALGQPVASPMNCTRGSADQLAACPQTRPHGELCRSFIGALPTRNATEVNCLQLETTQAAFMAACPGAFVCDRTLVPRAPAGPALAPPPTGTAATTPNAPPVAARPPQSPTQAPFTTSPTTVSPTTVSPTPQVTAAPTPRPSSAGAAKYDLFAGHVGFMVAAACTAALLVGRGL
jgi:hypothetical protein